MKCKNCGKEISDGFEYCEDCDQKLQEDSVFTISMSDIKGLKEDKKGSSSNSSEERPGKPIPRDGAMIDLEGYGKALIKDLTTSLAFVGALLLYLAPFMSWVWMEERSNKKSGTLFELASRNRATAGVISNVYNLNKKIFLFIAIGIIICAVLLLVLSACDYISSLRFLGDLKWLRIGILLVIVALFVAMIANPEYRNVLHSVKSSVAASGGQIDGGSGAGPAFYVSGFVFSLIANVNEIGFRK